MRRLVLTVGVATLCAVGCERQLDQAGAKARSVKPVEPVKQVVAARGDLNPSAYPGTGETPDPPSPDSTHATSSVASSTSPTLPSGVAPSTSPTPASGAATSPPTPSDAIGDDAVTGPAPSWRAILELARARGFEEPVGRGPRLALDERRSVAAIVHAVRDEDEECQPDRLRLSALLLEQRPGGLELVASRVVHDTARDGFVETRNLQLAGLDDPPDDPGVPKFRELAEFLTVSSRLEDVDHDGHREILLRYAWSENCPGGGMTSYRNLAILDGRALVLQVNLGIEDTIVESTGVRFGYEDVNADGFADLKGVRYSSYEGEEDEPFTAVYDPAQDRYGSAPGPFSCTQWDVC